jgi:mannose-1-phosphate guanylyltransferase
MSAGRGVPPLHAVILAGGTGERFWPASRAARPKPLLALERGRTLLSAALERARRVAGPRRVWLVCGREHAAAMRRAAGLPAARVLVEPVRRNTAMAIALAAHRIAARDPDAVLAVLPADHRIGDAAAFRSALRRAARAAREGVLVTLGVRPTRADPGLGYIALGAPVGSPHGGLHRVRRFVEKPSAGRARRFLESGAYLWNAGIFVFRARAILEEIDAHAPELGDAMSVLRQASPRGRPGSEAGLARAYRAARPISIDHAVLERSRRVWCLPVSFAWSDLGTWQSLGEALGVNRERSAVVQGEMLAWDAAGNLVWGRPRRPVALVGVEGLAVVDTGDALLVARLDRSGDVRRIVSELRGRGRRDLV